MKFRGQSYRLCITQPVPTSDDSPVNLADARIELDWRLSQLLDDYKDVIEQRLKLSSSLAAFLVEFKAIAESCVASQSAAGKQQAPKLPPSFFSRVIQEIEDLGWDKLSYVDPSFSSIQLTAFDEDHRAHPVTVHFESNYPSMPPRCTVDLPAAFDLRWPPKEGSLSVVYRQFSETLTFYADFWRLMDEIDGSVWVLEPEQPNRMAVLRRIAISSSTSVQIEVDPLNPRSLPTIQLLGASQAVSPLRDHLNKNLDDWDNQHTLLDNLTMLLGVQFPSKANTNKEEFHVACGICYAYRLDDATPTEVCTHERCKQPFHHLCLYEWLRTLPTSRVSFNVIFGSCPYCEQPITVKVAG